VEKNKIWKYVIVVILVGIIVFQFINLLDTIWFYNLINANSDALKNGSSENINLISGDEKKNLTFVKKVLFDSRPSPWGLFHMSGGNNLADFSKIDYLLIDIRGIEEYNKGHLKGAYHFPMNELLFEEGIGELLVLAGNRTIIFYCNSGGRSEHFDRMLRDKNITNYYFFAKTGLFGSMSFFLKYFSALILVGFLLNNFFIIRNLDKRKTKEAVLIWLKITSILCIFMLLVFYFFTFWEF